MLSFNELTSASGTGKETDYDVLDSSTLSAAIRNARETVAGSGIIYCVRQKEVALQAGKHRCMNEEQLHAQKSVLVQRSRTDDTDFVVGDKRCELLFFRLVLFNEICNDALDLRST